MFRNVQFGAPSTCEEIPADPLYRQDPYRRPLPQSTIDLVVRFCDARRAAIIHNESYLDNAKAANLPISDYANREAVDAAGSQLFANWNEPHLIQERIDKEVSSNQMFLEIDDMQRRTNTTLSRDGMKMYKGIMENCGKYLNSSEKQDLLDFFLPPYGDPEKFETYMLGLESLEKRVTATMTLIGLQCPGFRNLTDVQEEIGISSEASVAPASIFKSTQVQTMIPNGSASVERVSSTNPYKTLAPVESGATPVESTGKINPLVIAGLAVVGLGLLWKRRS